MFKAAALASKSIEKMKIVLVFFTSKNPLEMHIIEAFLYFFTNVMFWILNKEGF